MEYQRYGRPASMYVDIDSLRDEYESGKDWRFRKKFLELNQDKLSLNRLIYLSQCFVDIALYGSLYSPSVMEEVRTRSVGILHEGNSMKMMEARQESATSLMVSSNPVRLSTDEVDDWYVEDPGTIQQISSRYDTQNSESAFGNIQTSKRTNISHFYDTQKTKAISGSRREAHTSKTTLGNIRCATQTSKTKLGNIRCATQTSKTKLGNIRCATQTSKTKLGNIRCATQTSKTKLGNIRCATQISKTTIFCLKGNARNGKKTLSKEECFIASQKEQNPVLKKIRMLAYEVFNLQQNCKGAENKLNAASNCVPVNIDYQMDNRPDRACDRYLCHVLVDGIEVACGKGRRMKHAKKDACMTALAVIMMPSIEIVEAIHEECSDMETHVQTMETSGRLWAAEKTLGLTNDDLDESGSLSELSRFRKPNYHGQRQATVNSDKIDILRGEYESGKEWELRRKFMEFNYGSLSLDRLVCLSRCFVNIALYGCSYPWSVMKEIHKRSSRIFHEGGSEKKIQAKLKYAVSFVKASGYPEGSSMDASDDECEDEPETIQRINSRYNNQNSKAFSNIEISKTTTVSHSWSNASSRKRRKIQNSETKLENFHDETQNSETELDDNNFETQTSETELDNINFETLASNTASGNIRHEIQTSKAPLALFSLKFNDHNKKKKISLNKEQCLIASKTDPNPNMRKIRKLAYEIIKLNSTCHRSEKRLRMAGSCVPVTIYLKMEHFPQAGVNTYLCHLLVDNIEVACCRGKIQKSKNNACKAAIKLIKLQNIEIADVVPDEQQLGKKDKHKYNRPLMNRSTNHEISGGIHFKTVFSSDQSQSDKKPYEADLPSVESQEKSSETVLSSVQSEGKPSVLSSVQNEGKPSESVLPSVQNEGKPSESVLSSVQNEGKPSESVLSSVQNEGKPPESFLSSVQDEGKPSVLSSVQNEVNPSVLSSVQNEGKPSVLSSVQNEGNPYVLSSVQNEGKPSVLSSLQNEGKPSVLSSVQNAEKPYVLSSVQNEGKPSVLSSLQNEGKPSVLSSVQNAEKPSVLSSVQNEGKLSVLSSVQNEGKPSVLSSVQNEGKPSVLSSVQNEGKPSVLSSVQNEGKPSESVLSSVQNEGKPSESVLSSVQNEGKPSESVLSSVQNEGKPSESVLSSVQNEGKPSESVLSSVQNEGKPSESVLSSVQNEGKPSESVLSSVQNEGKPSESVLSSVQNEGKPSESVLSSVQNEGKPPESVLSSVQNEGKPPESVLSSQQSQTLSDTVQKLSVNEQEPSCSHMNSQTICVSNSLIVMKDVNVMTGSDIVSVNNPDDGCVKELTTDLHVCSGPDTQNSKTELDNIIYETQASRRELGNISCEAQASKTELDNIIYETQASRRELGNISCEAQASKTELGNISREAQASKTELGNISREAQTSKIESGNISREAQTSKIESGNISCEAQASKTQLGNINCETQASKTELGNISREAHTSKTTVTRNKGKTQKVKTLSIEECLTAFQTERNPVLKKLRKLAYEILNIKTKRLRPKKQLTRASKLVPVSIVYKSDYVPCNPLGNFLHRVVIDGIEVASKLGRTKNNVRRQACEAAITAIMMPKLNVIQSGNNLPLLKGSDLSWKKYPDQLKSAQPNTFLQNSTVGFSQATQLSREGTPVYKESKIKSVGLKRSQDQSKLLDKFIIVEQADSAKEGAEQILQKSSVFNHGHLDYEFVPQESATRCIVKINNEVHADVISISKSAAKATASVQCLKKLKSSCWVLKTKQAVDSNSTVSKKDVQDFSLKKSEQIGSDNVGNKLLQKMGWSGGGIGKKGQGISEPISLMAVSNRKGLGFGKVSGKKDDFKKRVRDYMQNYYFLGNEEDLVFSHDFDAAEKKVIHEECRKLNLLGVYGGKCDEKYVCVSRKRSADQLFEHVRKSGGETAKYKLLPPGTDARTDSNQTSDNCVDNDAE